MSNLEEKQISSEKLLSAKIINVRRDKVLSPKGECFREVVEHSGGVVILPYIDKDNIILIKQWRYAAGKELIELPAGKLEPKEDPFECAKRELTEETGYKAKNWNSLGYIYTSPGFCNEKLYLYKASDLEYAGTNFDEFETIENLITPIKKAYEMIVSGKIVDSKTICALCHAKIEDTL